MASIYSTSIIPQGIQILPSAVDFPAVGTDGQQLVAADTNTIYIYQADAPAGWKPVANPGAAIAIDALTGEVTATGPGVVAATITNSAVTNAKLAAMADNTVKGNKSGAPASPSDLALSNVTEAVSSVLTISNGSKTVVSAADLTIEVKQSSAVQSGYLSSGDWSTFSNKVSSVGATAPIASSGGTTPTISISQSGVATDGYLSSTDWNSFNSKQPGGNYITALTSDVTATGPGSVAATVAFVGGKTSSEVATSVTDTQNATALSTPSTLMERDGSGETALDGLSLDGSTSGAIKLQAAATTTNYTVKLPSAQGAASTFLQNDGSGNLSWTAPSSLPSQTGNQYKVLATDGSTASWQYAGLGDGSFGTNNIFVGRGYNNTGFTPGTDNVVIGLGTGPGNSLGGCVIIGNRAGAANGISNAVAIGIEAAGNNPTASNVVAVGYQALYKNADHSDSVGVGYQAGYNNAGGLAARNAYLGYRAGFGGGLYNSAVGYGACGTNQSYCQAVGYESLGASTGDANTAIGFSALKSVNGNYNIGVGNRAGLSASGSYGLFIGNYAGSQSVASNEFYLSNLTAQLANNALEKTNSLMYGQFNATPSSQTLTVNATTTSTYGYLTALGSVTAPTYSFTGDTNTGLWSSAADTVNLSTGGSERLRVDSTGVVRINTTALIGTNVSEKLEVKGVIKAVGTDASNLGWFYAMGDGTSYGGGFQIWKDNSSSSNSWAIAMQTPGSAISDDLVISNPDGGWHECLRIKKAGDVIINETGASVDVRIEGDTDANLLVTDGSADRVGIGTATPSEKLEVSGNILASEVAVANYKLSPKVHDEGTETGNFTINWANSPVQLVTLNGTTNAVVTLSNPVTGGAYAIKIVQGATPGTIDFTAGSFANVKWPGGTPPTLSGTTGDIDLINLLYIGTTYYGTFALDFA